ncbi:MAG: hypothetical protein HUJ68_07870 [Clostridia bacterium]|nr:hypothetical protein [Clostridia bacterium]
MLVSARELRNGRLSDVPKDSGYYIWWFREDGARELLKNVKGINWGRIQTKIIFGETYYALYFGISKDIQQRLKWHILQHHVESQVESGRISTLRQTESALLDLDVSVSERDINDFVDENCYVEFIATESEKDAREIERSELRDHYYPLNIQDNRALEEDVKKYIKEQRAKHGRR